MNHSTNEVAPAPNCPQWIIRRRIALAALLAMACAGANIGDSLYVKRPALDIRSGIYAFDKILGTASQGDELTVVGVKGKWLKVQYLPPATDPARPAQLVEGYVLADAISARQVAAATTRETGSAAQVGAAGAGKGEFKGILDSGKYAQDRGLNPEAFYKMVTDSRAAINDRTFDEFTRVGQIGPYKPKAVQHASAARVRHADSSQ